MTPIRMAAIVPGGAVVTTALVLSGGGATGAFEVGALKYLYANLFRPDIICATSVGAVNALKLAEGEGPEPNRGFAGLEELWLGLKTDDDMYVLDQWVQDQPGWIQDILNGINVTVPIYCTTSILK
jgi:NTE family protein